MSVHQPAIASALFGALFAFGPAAFAQETKILEAGPTARAATLVSDGVAAKPAADPACPRIVVLRGAESFPRGKDEGFKATVEGLARDCADLGAETLLKVGVVGEGARSGKNGPSWFNAPLSLAVMDAGGKAVATRTTKIRVQLPRGAAAGAFTHLEENLSLPPAPEGYAGWAIVVGFEMGPAELQRAARLSTADRR